MNAPRVFSLVLAFVLIMALPVSIDTKASRADKDWVTISMMGASTWYIGDQKVSFTIKVKNHKDDLMGYKNTLYDVTVKITGIREGISDIEFTKSEDNVGEIYSGSLGYAGPFEVNIGGNTPIGTFSLTVKVTYEYYPSQNSTKHSATGSETEYIQITIKSVFNLGDIRAYSEDDPPKQSRLYSGCKFQRVGIYTTLNSQERAPNGPVKAILSGSHRGIKFDYTTSHIQNIRSDPYIFFRVDVADDVSAGRYKYTLTLEYTRNDYYTDHKDVSMKEVIDVELQVDFTPLLSVESNEISIIQGEVMKKDITIDFINSGNAKLRKMRVWLDISNYFKGSDAYYYDGHGNLHIVGGDIYIDELNVGESYTATFPVEIFKYLPAGTHRLEVMYEGYYLDEGTVGGSTDYKWTTQETYKKIKGDGIYINVSVRDYTPDIEIECINTISLHGRIIDATLQLKIENREDVDFKYAEIVFPCKDVKNNVVFINPRNPTSPNLEKISLMTIPASYETIVSISADVNPNVSHGFHTFSVNVFGMNDVTMEPMTTTVNVSVRILPSPPILNIRAIYDEDDIKPGKNFTLTLLMRNDGNDDARNFHVSTFSKRPSASYIVSGSERADIYSAEGALSPFSPTISKKYVGTVPAGGECEVSFDIKVDSAVIKGKMYLMNVVMEYTDTQGIHHTENVDIGIYVKGNPPEKMKDESLFWYPLNAGIILILVIWALTICTYFFLKILDRKFKLGKPPIAEARIPPPPPPPGMAQIPTIPPPPAHESAEPSGGKKKGKIPVHPPSAYNICKSCGSTVEPRASHCSKCGAKT